jgi:hypothetical protein
MRFSSYAHLKDFIKIAWEAVSLGSFRHGRVAVDFVKFFKRDPLQGCMAALVSFPEKYCQANNALG